jgi:sporulation protein YlmC with PRC-barrel domain
MIDIWKLKGKMVITKDSFNVGEISEVSIDDNWKITHVHVKLTKESTNELGFKKPLFGYITICLPVYYVRGVGDVLTLNQSKAELRKMPECKTT